MPFDNEAIGRFFKEKPALAIGIVGGVALGGIYLLTKRGKGSNNQQLQPYPFVPMYGPGSYYSGVQEPTPNPTPNPLAWFHNGIPSGTANHRPSPVPVMHHICPVGYTWDVVSQQCIGTPGPTPNPFPTPYLPLPLPPPAQGPLPNPIQYQTTGVSRLASGGALPGNMKVNKGGTGGGKPPATNVHRPAHFVPAFGGIAYGTSAYHVTQDRLNRELMQVYR